ncbi:MAG TPA: hypothetical protein VF063_00660 [Gaiellaceae bacterium]
MRSRSREITFRDGTTIETPLLVPSLSSKGFAPVEVGDQGEAPAPAGTLNLFGADAFYESLLLSAYDIHYQQVLEPESLKKGYAKSPYAIPQFLIIDSGWYEATPGSDLGEPYEETRESREWTPEQYRATVESLDPDLKAALVSFDVHGPYEEQISAAQEFFADHPQFVRTLMLKPPGAGSYHQNQIKKLAPDAKRLRVFDIIGVTEKELGNTIVNRLKTVFELATMLDEAGVDAPIHVFGGLDPLYTPLYFAAGAEIFDGLTWLRYGYYEGMGLYRQSLPILKRQFDKRLPFAILDAQADNLDAMRELSRELKVFADQNEDWNVLRNGALLKPAHDALRSAVSRRSRGR